jgi:hypothetical protein
VRVAQPCQRLAQGGVGRDHDAFELVDGLGPGLDRGPFRELEQPQLFDRAIARLRGRGRATGVERR